MQKIYTIYVLKDSILKEKFVIGGKIYDRVTRQIPPPGGGKPPPNWPNPWPPNPNPEPPDINPPWRPRPCCMPNPL